MSYIDRQPIDRNFLSKDNFSAVFSNFPLQTANAWRASTSGWRKSPGLH